MPFLNTANPAGPAIPWLARLLTGGALLLTSGYLPAEEIESAIARGGRLYDKWWKVVGTDSPKGPHPAYPAEAKYKGKGGADWRCKECHGWDYRGKDGAYSQGGHFTGIKGVRGAAGAEVSRIVGVLSDKTHGMNGALRDGDLRDLALFISEGQVDMDQYIDRATRKVAGDKAKGEPIYQTLCANCHGRDGTVDEDGKPLAADGEPLGRVANSNPWEALHKIRNGQPGERMPALRAFDIRIALDVLAYLQTLPTEVVAAARKPEQR